MAAEERNPLKMIHDPFAGDSFVFPETKCTNERVQFLSRMNEIYAFLYVTILSFDVCGKEYRALIPKLPFKEKTPIRIELSSGHFVVMPANRIIKLTESGLAILTRQIFVMFYGSFETYLFQLFERSYPHIGIVEDTLDISLDVLMRKKWDGKFNKMHDVFCIDYKAGDLREYFSGFEMSFEGSVYKDPLAFLDEIAQIRHRIIHASSIYEGDILYSINNVVLHEFFGFYFHLTDYVDNLFAKHFKYEQILFKPAQA